MAYVVALPPFEGPLDLLLTLIDKAKIDIKDIFVSDITEQYLEYTRSLTDADMDSASEFLTMAATLLEIKSRALLPPPEYDDYEDETPEDELIRRLTEYKAIKDACGDMQKLEAYARDMLCKLPEEYPLPPPETELVGLTLTGLAAAFRRVLERAAMVEESGVSEQRSIRRDDFNVQVCAYRIQKRLQKGPVAFSELFSEYPTRTEVVSVFLALLELLKLNRVEAEQQGLFGEIVISPAKRQDGANDGGQPEREAFDGEYD